MKFFVINPLFKADTAKITWLKKLFIFLFSFFSFLFHTFVNFLIYVFKTFFYVLFCPFNCFFGLNKSVQDRNLKTISCSMIYTFPSYFTSDGTVRNFYKLMEYFTLVFRNMLNYSFF